MLKFVHTSDSIKSEEKKVYIKTLRAQLSNFEQALLYFNSFWGPGKRMWFDKDKKSGYVARYILEYKLIKNIPFHLVSFTITPSIKFKQELQKAHPEKGDKWLNITLFDAFEELENLLFS
ncbi:putative phage abortive infection protein [Roseivirga sp.]|uniref:putative phage abortive infection protein n=1 Tax=Roseivirga sp. TaxID=1964215 RepID=UPI003B519EA3